MPSYRLPRLRRPVVVLCALLLGWLVVVVGPGPSAWASPYADEAGPVLTLPSDVEFVLGRSGDSYVVEADGDPVPAIGVDKLPAGLRLVAHGDGTATLQGNPTGPAGVSTVAVSAQNAAGSTTAPLTVTVHQAPAFVGGSTLEFSVGRLDSFTVSTIGFPAPSIGLDGDLPGGLSFVDNGDGTATIAGTPVEAASVPVTLTAVNVVADASRTTSIRVLAEAPGPPASPINAPSTGPRWEM